MSATICKICGLPIFHGPAGYSGPKCMCKYQTLPQMFDNSMARLSALEAERDQLKVENERLAVHINKMIQKRDTLRKQLDEARELLTRYWKETPIGYQPHMIAHIADAWLEANK